MPWSLKLFHVINTYQAMILEGRDKWISVHSFIDEVCKVEVQVTIALKQGMNQLKKKLNTVQQEEKSGNYTYDMMDKTPRTFLKGRSETSASLI